MKSSEICPCMRSATCQTSVYSNCGILLLVWQYECDILSPNRCLTYYQQDIDTRLGQQCRTCSHTPWSPLPSIISLQRYVISVPKPQDRSGIYSFHEHTFHHYLIVIHTITILFTWSDLLIYGRLVIVPLSTCISLHIDRSLSKSSTLLFIFANPFHSSPHFKLQRSTSLSIFVYLH